MGAASDWTLSSRGLSAMLGCGKGTSIEFKRPRDKYPSVELHIAPVLGKGFSGEEIVTALRIVVMHGHPDECSFTSVEIQA